MQVGAHFRMQTLSAHVLDLAATQQRQVRVLCGPAVCNLAVVSFALTVSQ